MSGELHIWFPTRLVMQTVKLYLGQAGSLIHQHTAGHCIDSYRIPTEFTSEKEKPNVAGNTNVKMKYSKAFAFP